MKLNAYTNRFELADIEWYIIFKLIDSIVFNRYKCHSKSLRKIYCKKNYTLTDVWVSWWTTDPTKAYLFKYYNAAAIAWNSLRLYTTPQIDVSIWSQWTERRPSGDVDKDWKALAISRDWLKMIAGAAAWLLYTSSDWWVNRTERVVQEPVYVENLMPSWVLSWTKTVAYWLYFTTKWTACKLRRIVKSWWVTATRCMLFDTSHNLLATATVSWDYAFFDYALSASTTYIIEWDNSWSNYTVYEDSDWSWWYDTTYFTINWSSVDWVKTAWTLIYNVDNIVISYTWSTWTTHDRNHVSISNDWTKAIICTNDSVNDWNVWTSSDSWATWN